MSDSYLDHIPSIDRERIKKRLRSPEAYAALRERVKGPEDLERHMEQMDRMAEAHFALESDPKMQESLRSHIEKDISEQGIDAVLDAAKASPEARKAVEEGKFVMKVSAHPKTKEDALHAVTEGRVQEKLPVKPNFSDRYVSQLLQSKPHA